MKYFRVTIIVLVTVFFLNGCANQQSVQLDRDIFHLKLENTTISLQLQRPIIHKFHRYVQNAYTIDEGAFHIEYIRLPHNVHWNGSPAGYFRYHFTQEFKNAQTVNILKSRFISAYEYQYDGKTLYIISISNTMSKTFIVDYTGFIVSKIFDGNYHIPLPQQTQKRLKKSLLDNYLESYFAPERERRLIL